MAAGAIGRSPHSRGPGPPGPDHQRRGKQQRRRRRAARGRTGHQPEHHRQHPALQTPWRNQEPPHQLQAGGGGGNQPAAGHRAEQESDVQRRRAESKRQEEEERKVWKEEGGREEEEEGALPGVEAGGRSRKWTPPGVEVSARPAEGAALKRCQSLTKVSLQLTHPREVDSRFQRKSLELL